MKKRPPALILLYVLHAYVVLQFIWWAYLIYDLNAEVVSLSNVPDQQAELMQKLWMIIGEGTVFFALLFVGAYYIRKFLLREHRLAVQERNFLLATTHELNSPIAGIKLNLQTLRRPGINDEQRDQMLDSGLANIQRLESLVGNILLASRMDAGKLQLDIQPCPLHEVVEKVEKRFRQQLAQKGNTLRVLIPDDITVRADRTGLETVIDNLLQNALKYAPGVAIELTAVVVEQQVRITYADRGPGVPKEVLKRIFQKFYRLENEETRSQKGTGLGLYLVSQMIRLHEGTIQASNHEKGGLTITIHLPKA